MIRHDAFLELAAVAIDFELSAAERTRLEAHLASCPACLRAASALHADARSLATLPPVRLGERRADQLLAGVLATPRASLGSLRLLAVAALLVVLAVGGILVGAELLRRATDDDLSVLPVPSASLDPDASPVADNGVGMRWERTDIPESAVSQPGGASMGGVIAGGPGAIAWGFVYGSEPRIWTTSDGRTWERATVPVPGDADPEYQEPGSVSAIVAAGPGYIATGHYYRLGTGRRALLWTSVDGRTWDLLPHDPVFENAVVNDIVPWRGELLAFGQWSAAPGGGATPARLWSSRDGLTWASEELSLPTGLTMSFAAATADRLWATASPEGDDTAGPEAVVIISSDDGRTWSGSDLQFSRGRLTEIGGSLLTLVPPWPLPAPDFTPPPTPPGQLSPGLYRATGSDSWEPVSRGLSAAGNDLIEVGDTLILVGDDSAGDPRCWEDCQATGWRSIDGGVSWQVVPADVVGGTMAAVAAVPGGRLVAVGHVLDDHGNPTPAAWVSEPAAAPTASPETSPSPSASPLANASASPALAALGADLVWERAPDQTTFADAGMVAVAAGSDRYVAVGCATATEFNASECSGAAWWATDGVTWRRAAMPDAEPLYLAGVVAAPIGYLAWAYDVGASPGAAFWFSSDGTKWERAPTIPSFSFNHVFEVVWFNDNFVAHSDWNEKLIWVSDDGLAWRDQAGCDAPASPAAPDPFGDSVHLIAVGEELLRIGTAYLPEDETDDRGAQDYRRVISRSTDGDCSISTTASDGWILDIAATGDGYIGVGRQHDPAGSGAGSPPPPMAAWTSSDGSAWVPSTFTGGTPAGELALVASGDRGVLATGSTDSQGLTVWRSADGSTWSQADAPPESGVLEDLAAISGGFIAVGRETAANGDVTAVVWIAR